MEPQPTVVLGPIQLRIADDLRMKIERGELQPGDRLPSAHDLGLQWACSPSSGRAAINLLKKQGLVTGHQGSAPTVRIQPRQAILKQTTNQLEKDRVLLSEEERRKNGAAEDDLDVSINDLNFTATYNRIPASREFATLFNINEGAELLRREYETTHKKTNIREQWSVSYIPTKLIQDNPQLLEARNEPWPGGTQHQLYTVGIEIARMDNEVTAAMPTTVEAQRWAIPDGIPLLLGRRIAIDIYDRVIEISEAQYPADRTKMMFSITLSRWEKN